MSLKIEPESGLASIPVGFGGMVRLSDLRDLMEILDGEPEDNLLQILPGELRYQLNPFPAGWDRS